MTGFVTTRAAFAAAALLYGVGSAAAGPLPLPAAPGLGAAPVTLPVQYYGYPPYPYRRPYGYYRPYGAYRPYGYGPRPWLYGPGAAKQRYRTRLDFCKVRPDRC